MALLRVGSLAPEALAAAAQFHGEILPRVEAALLGEVGQLVLIFPPADYSHYGWRLAAVQQLARKHAPVRVNALVGEDEAAIAAAVSYLGTADGVTGQVLPLDGNDAGEVLYYKQ